MAYFPFMVDIGEMECLIIGGSRVAFHKTDILLKFGVNINVVSPEFCDDFFELINNKNTGVERNLSLYIRSFEDSDIDGVDFVISATNDKDLNHHISNICKAKKIPINVVDDREDCSFLFPAIVKNNDLLVAISSGGKSPAAVHMVKNMINSQMPDFYGILVDNMGRYRKYILESVGEEDARKYVFDSMLDYGMKHEGVIPNDVVDEIIVERANTSGNND